MYTTEKYTIKHNKTKSEEISYSLHAHDKNTALHTERRILYVVKNGDDFLYVGEAKSSLKIRFDRGFIAYRYYKRNGDGRGGYKGYKWIELLETSNMELQVFAFVFNSDYDKDDSRKVIEAIEGELVYLIRNNYGYWPKFQNEIHFQNIEGAKEIAEGILEKALNQNQIRKQ